MTSGGALDQRQDAPTTSSDAATTGQDDRRSHRPPLPSRDLSADTGRVTLVLVTGRTHHEVAGRGGRPQSKEAVRNLDLGLQGLGILVALSLGFGVIVQFISRGSATHWLWLVGRQATVGGLLASEVFWGTLTEEEIQPIIGGLAFDESLLGGLLVGVPVVLVAWFLTRHPRIHGAAPT
jgi:hypothetical protein